MDILHFLRAVFEILVLWILFYQLYRAFKDSRAAAILGGLVIIVLASIFLLKILHASVLQHIASAIVGPGTILVILFQTEIRTALAKLGTHPFLSKLFLKRERNNDFVTRVCESVAYLTSKRFGALIAICRQNKLSEWASSGTMVDAVYTRELIGTIFMPKTLLHDGAVIVDNERVVSAAAILPVSNKELKDSSMGLRHRAGIGLAEASDAVVIIVSEETGTISLVVGNVLQRDLSEKLLRTRLIELLYTQHDESTPTGENSENDHL